MADKNALDPIKALQENIEILESRNAFQDDIIEQLNDEIANHQQQLAELKNQLSLIASRIKDNNTDNGGKEEIEPPPPHY